MQALPLSSYIRLPPPIVNSQQIQHGAKPPQSVIGQLLENTRRLPPATLVGIDPRTVAFHELLYGPGYAAHLWAEPIRIPGRSQQFPPLTPTPRILTNPRGDISIPLVFKLRQHMEKARVLPARVPTLASSGVQWTQNTAFPRFPFLFFSPTVQFNGNVIPLPYNLKKIRYLSVLRSLVQHHGDQVVANGDAPPSPPMVHTPLAGNDVTPPRASRHGTHVDDILPHDNFQAAKNIHSAQGTCYGDFYPANYLQRQKQASTTTSRASAGAGADIVPRPSDKEYASWFGYKSPKSIPWIPQLPPFPMIPENDLILTTIKRRQQQHKPDTATASTTAPSPPPLTFQQRQELYKLQPPVLGHTAEYKLYQKLVPWVFLCFTEPNILTDRSLNVLPGEEVTSHRALDTDDAEDGRTFVTSCGTIGMQFDSAQSQLNTIPTNWGQSFLDVAVVDSRLDFLISPLEECYSRMRPVPYFAWEGRAGSMTNSREKNWNIFPFGFGSIFNLNVFVHLQNILLHTPISDYYDAPKHLITLTPAQRQQLHLMLENEFDISRPLAIYRSPDPMRIAYGPYDIQSQSSVLSQCWQDKFDWPKGYRFNFKIHNGPQPILVAIPPNDPDNSLSRTRFVYVTVSHSIGKRRGAMHYFAFVVFIDPQTLEYVGVAALNWPTDSNTHDIHICSEADEKNCGSIDSRPLYKHAMWVNEPPLSFQTQGDQRPPTMLPTIASLDSQTFVSSSWGDQHMHLTEIDLRHLWHYRATCDSQAPLSVKWTDMPQHGLPGTTVQPNHDRNLPLPYSGLSFAWGDNFHQWWAKHHFFDLHTPLADVLSAESVPLKQSWPNDSP